METKGNLICFKCKHFNQFEGCALFEDGAIPDVVLESNQHKNEIPGQVAPGFYKFDKTKTNKINL